MTILSTYTFNPDLAELFTEAFERAGIDPASIGDRHIRSALRSCSMMLNSEWATYGNCEFNLPEATLNLVAGTATYQLATTAPGFLDLVTAILRRGGRDTEVFQVSMADYLLIPNKTQRGRPDRYKIDKTETTASITFWPVPENSTDQFVFNFFRTVSDIGEMANTAPVPENMREAFVCGLAFRMAQKFNQKLYPVLRAEYGGPNFPERLGGQLGRALIAARGNSDVQITRRR